MRNDKSKKRPSISDYGYHSYVGNPRKGSKRDKKQKKFLKALREWELDGGNASIS